MKPKTAEPDWKEIRGWRNQLVHLLGTRGRVTASSRDGMPKPVSNATMEKREKRLFAALNELQRMGCKFKSLDSLQRRHIKALGTKWAKDGHSPSTIQNDLSMLRLLFQWIDKPEIMGESAEFVPSKQFVTRTTHAQYDHSWTAAGVAADRLIGLVSQYDRHVGIQLRLCHAFYLRRQEAVMFKTHQLDRTASSVQCLARCGRRPRRPRGKERLDATRCCPSPHAYVRLLVGRKRTLITRPRTSLIGLDYVFIEGYRNVSPLSQDWRINAPAIHAIKGANDH